MRAKLLIVVGLLMLAASASAGRSYPSWQGTPMKRLEIRDAKATDFLFAREFAKAYLQGRARGQGTNWTYYEGPKLLYSCIEKTGLLSSEACRNSLDLELTVLDFAVGPECVEAQGLKTRKDMRSLLRRYLREAPEEAREAGNLLGPMAFLRYADPKRCPESPGAAASRAERKKLTAGAARGDAEEQYQLALRTFGSESARWHCLAAKNGHAAAQYEYGAYHEFQKSNPLVAYRWYVLSAKRGYWQAPAAVHRLEQSLSPADLAQAKDHAEGWQNESCP